MEKQDFVYLAVAVIIVALLAIVVKPVLSGEQVDIGSVFSSGERDTIENRPTDTPSVTPSLTTVIAPSRTPLPIQSPTPTPTPVWNGKTKSVGFVDPLVYHIAEPEPKPTSAIAQTTIPDTTLVTYAVIQGRWSGTTQILQIPFPYWEMHYTAEPSVDITKDEIRVFPRINIQVMDADDPNRFVRTVDSNILDPRLFKENDPRPWVEKFYEGNHNYYFVIKAQFISSYKIEVMVPKRYL